jgi:hypothetical protein
MKSVGRPAVGMVVIVPAGLPQESRPGGPTGSIKERVGSAAMRNLAETMFRTII